jgi:hypothetical protein
MEGQTPLPTFNGRGDINEVEKDGEKVLEIDAWLSEIYGQTISPKGKIVKAIVIPDTPPSSPALAPNFAEQESTPDITEFLQDVGEIKDGHIKISLPARGIGLFFVGELKDDEFITEASLVLAKITEEKRTMYIIMENDGKYGFLEAGEEGLNLDSFMPSENPEDAPSLEVKPIADLPNADVNWHCFKEEQEPEGQE